MNISGKNCQGIPCFINTVVLLYVYLAEVHLIPTAIHVYGSAPPDELVAWAIRHRLATIFFAVMTFWSYHATVSSDPGTPPSDMLEMLNSDDERVTWCRKCNKFKPPRAHHCSICGHCILRFDHHCDWVDNCVGIGNHKVFYLFLVYICAAICHYMYLVVVVYGAPALYHNMAPPSHHRSHQSTASHPEQSVTPAFVVHTMTTVLFVFMVVPLTLFAGGFLAYHTYLICADSTTMGIHEGEGMYTRLSCFGSWRTVMGPLWCWAVPIPAVRLSLRRLAV